MNAVTPPIFDTHAHLDYPPLSTDTPAVVARAIAAGVTRIVSIGTDLESSARAVRLSEQHPEIYAAVGWHPNEAHLAPEDLRPALRELARHPKVVALGETGLDYYRLPSREGQGTSEDDATCQRRQAALFQQHLEVAAETGLPCVIHQRAAFADVRRQFAPFAGRVRAVFHCFSEDLLALQKVLELGCLVSYTGILTFRNAAAVREALAATPFDRFMLETDSPYLAPVPHRGRTCEPAFVRDTAVVAAEVKGCTLAELSEATCATARAFFPKLK